MISLPFLIDVWSEINFSPLMIILLPGPSKPLELPAQAHKFRVSASSRKKIKSSIEKIKQGDDEQPNFLSSKAAKVATLSQALGHFDQFRKSQAAKTENQDKDKEDEIKTLVTNVIEVCGSKVKLYILLHLHHFFFSRSVS